MLGRQQKVYMIGHQNIGMEVYFVRFACLPKVIEVKLKILISEETRPSIVSTLNNVDGHVGKFESRTTGQA